MSDMFTDLSIAQMEAFRLAMEERRLSRFGRLPTFRGWNRSEEYLSLRVHARLSGVSPKSLLRKARKTLHREHQQAKLATLEPKLYAVIKCIDEFTPALENLANSLALVSKSVSFTATYPNPREEV